MNNLINISELNRNLSQEELNDINGGEVGALIVDQLINQGIRTVGNFLAGRVGGFIGGRIADGISGAPNLSDGTVTGNLDRIPSEILDGITIPEFE